LRLEAVETVSLWFWLSLVLTSYLIGGIPTSYVATRLRTGRDIRQIGDRNAGAANVYRNVSRKTGLAVGSVDVVKGVAAVVLVQGLVDSTSLEMAAGVAVVAGHNWPLVLGLRGGRGAATALGVLLAMLPALAIPVGMLTLVVLYLTRKATPALGFFLIAVPVLSWISAVLSWPADYSYPLATYSVGIPVMVGISHFLSTRKSVPGRPAQPADGDERALPGG
jgi:glycerol-3-phosphate acyltransferase PlsY